MDEPSHKVILNQIIDLVKEHTATTENINSRINSIERKLDNISHHVHGNGEPGLTETTRSIKRELEDIKQDFENLDIEKLLNEKFSEIQKSYSIKEIESIKTQLKVQWVIAASIMLKFAGEFFQWFTVN